MKTELYPEFEKAFEKITLTDAAKSLGDQDSDSPRFSLPRHSFSAERSARR